MSYFYLNYGSPSGFPIGSFKIGPIGVPIDPIGPAWDVVGRFNSDARSSKKRLPLARARPGLTSARAGERQNRLNWPHVGPIGAGGP